MKGCQGNKNNEEEKEKKLEKEEEPLYGRHILTLMVKALQ